jgi:hypothetical protein
MNKNTLIVLGFLLLCIFLSLDKKEGFATINISEFEGACNADGTTCIVEATGSLGGNCLPSTDQSLYILSPGEAERDTHKESFNITASGCSGSAYPIPGQTISAQVCSNEGEAYTLSGCASKCTNAYQGAGGKPGYNVSLPQYVSPLEGTRGIVDVDEGSCTDGQMLPAINTCFNKDGTINGAETPERCRLARGIWYDSSGNNPIKLVCDNPDINSNYSVIGCEPACYSRISDLDQYMTTSDLSNQNKEIIQILHRTNPSTSDTEIITPQSSETPYNMTETNLNPGNFIVTGEPQITNFSSSPDGTPIPVDFAGVVDSSQGCNLSSPNTDLQRKYPVSGLFPVCDSQTHECLNFNITYDSGAPLNITDFKNTMDTNAGEIGIPDDELENYKNSLYYYRRYKDRDDKTHIEGQIRCNNDPTSPFHCIITDPSPPSPWYFKPLWRLMSPQSDHVDCNHVCQEVGLNCTTGEIDISEGNNQEDKMRNIISRLNLVDPDGYLEMINGYRGIDPDPAGLNFNNYDEMCVSYGGAESVPVDKMYNPEPWYANLLTSTSLPFGFISKEQSGYGVGHACYITQDTDTFIQSCGSEWMDNVTTNGQVISPICHCSNP